ncbi:MAG TPA: polyprenyl synthetase family protein [Opitutaceae bacterium]
MSSPLLDRIGVALVDNSPAAPGAEAHLQAALVQATGTPGKLLRAQLVFEAAQRHGLNDSAGESLACAIEYFHIASLLLDDLPCMDNAETRRGLPCVHRVHGEATAILAALALINRAYALAGFALAAQPLTVRLQAAACLDTCLGAAGLVGGQAFDLRGDAPERSAREVGRIAVAKTGALFRLAVLLPALAGSPTEAERRSLQALCVYWGLAFQALDDLRDVLATSVDAGKTTGRDRALARPNLALTLGVPASRTRVTRLEGQAAGVLERLIAADGARWDYLVTFHGTAFAANRAPARGSGAAA